MSPGTGGSPGPRLTWLLMGLLFAAALVCNLRVAGTSPILWNDTVYEEREVQACLRDNSCTSLGTSASIQGISFASGWLALRGAFGFMGLGLDGTHVLMQVLRSLTVVLVALMAFRLSGLTAAALATILATSGSMMLVSTPLLPIFPDGTVQSALYNVGILPFLGALFALLCVLANEEDGLTPLILAALVGAVMANVHVAGASAGVSLGAIALLRPHRRWVRFFTAVSAFGAATYLIAPAAWRHDFLALRKQLGQGGSHVAPTSSEGMPAQLLVVVALVWLGTMAFRGARASRARSGASVLLLIAMPPLLAVSWAAGKGLTSAEPRYYGFLAPVLAVVGGVALAAILGALVRALLIRDDEDKAQFRVLDRAAVVGAAAFLLFIPDAGGFAHLPRPRANEIQAAASLVRARWRWSQSDMYRALHAPYTQETLQLISAMLGEFPSGASTDPTTALFLTVPRNQVPKQLPPEVTVLSTNSPWTALVATTRSGLDWSAFEACTVEKSGFTRCEQTGLAPPPDDVAEERAPLRGMPRVVDVPHIARLQLKLQWHRSASGPETVFMPRMPDVCGGRITSVPSGGVLSPDGREAILKEEGQVTLEWALGSPECPAKSYDEFPPFFLAGESEPVRFLAGLSDQVEHL